MPANSSSKQYESAAQAYHDVLQDLVSAEPVSGVQAGAERVQGSTFETLNYIFRIANPLSRIVAQETQPLKLHVAVARFVWMMAGNNRLADIAFYEPRVSSFSDDSLTVPGSSYGMRMRQSQPGLDQIKAVIAKLKADPSTRRAAISIYHPIDAVRDSADIPCAFGVMFHGRAGKLNSTILMRSNNAWSLLPFNLFEFSMLAEVVAREAGFEPGELTYFAGSMHVYERDAERIRSKIVHPPVDFEGMRAMPPTPPPLDQINKLAIFEADLRHGSQGVCAGNVAEWVARAQSTLAPYWAQFAMILLSAVAAKRDQATLDRVLHMINPELRKHLPLEAARNGTPLAPTTPLFIEAGQTAVIVTLPQTALAQRFRQLSEKYEQAEGPIGAARLLAAQELIFERIAARGESEILTEEAFREALNAPLR
jgi:thymidylate synthase